MEGIIHHICRWALIVAVCCVLGCMAGSVFAAEPGDGEGGDGATDSLSLRFPVRPTVAPDYESLAKDEFALDLDTPSNVVTEVEYDPESGCYIVRTKVGDWDIATPFMLTPSQYYDIDMRHSMQRYFNRRNSMTEGRSVKEREPFNVLDMSFASGPLERIFGPGGIQLRTRGTVLISTGIKSTKTDNPALSLTSRRKTYFDFDQKIQATVNASVGDRLKFGMNYNTDATFDFDSKNIKLQYDGTEDDIVKSIEAGNVSMTTGSSLIRGSTALFGIKTQLQFGRLTATALVSQQNSESRSVSTRGGVQTTPFTVNADEYDANRHYFLGHFFR
ncbi:cell surface protein SprA, partial [uncultured Muribaculum sp.]